ncbi:MAG: Sec-independent protein translocase protein TatB [Dongiaceae bacterium]
MFDLGWDEMAVIAVVALVVLGPKELPNALRTVSGLMKQARKLASEFQSGVHEIIREAELEDAKKAVQDFSTKGTLAGMIEKTIDPAGELKSAFQKPEDDKADNAEINPAVAAFGPDGSAHIPAQIEEHENPIVAAALRDTPIERDAPISAPSLPTPASTTTAPTTPASAAVTEPAAPSNTDTEKSKTS